VKDAQPKRTGRNTGITTAERIEQVIAMEDWTADDLRPLLMNPRCPELSPRDRRSEPDEYDLAWAAGFFDGEGCVNIARQKYTRPDRQPCYRLNIVVTQSHWLTLQHFQWVVGLEGVLHETKPRNGKQTRKCYSLIYGGLQAIYVLRLLKRHLVRKEEQAELAFRFQREGQVHRHFGPRGCPEEIWMYRRRFHKLMHGLNRHA